MKIIIPLSVLLFLFIPSEAQQSFVEQSLVLNVEVPVRVFKGTQFIDNLTIDDFEILEDGTPQRIEACYLVKKAAVQRSEERKSFLPQTARHFYLFFEIADYLPKIDEALSHLFQNVIIPSDDLVIITPIKTYRLKEHSLQAKSKDAIAAELRGLIRKDCLAGNTEFRSTTDSLTEVAKSLSAAIREGYTGDTGEAQVLLGKDNPRDIDQLSQINEQLVTYATLLDKLDTLRNISQMKMLDFAHHLLRQDGQKYVFIFYQREYIPQIDPKIISTYSALYQDHSYIYQTLTRASGFRDREMSFDVARVKQAYADASTAVHFLFITTPRPEIEGVYLEERSEDVYLAFREMAAATGGIFQSSSNPAAMFEKALEAAENYYLLYYTPKKIESSEENFRTIAVHLKKAGYQVFHRSGYFLR
jgi:VWFA-related protein